MANSFVSGACDDSDWLFGVVLCFGALPGPGGYALITSVASCGYFRGAIAGWPDAWCDAGIARGAFLGFWSGLDQATRWGTGWISIDSMAWGYGWATNAIRFIAA